MTRALLIGEEAFQAVGLTALYRKRAASVLLTIITSTLTAACVYIALAIIRGFREQSAANRPAAPQWLQSISSLIDAHGAVRQAINICVTLIFPGVFTLLTFGEQVGLTKPVIVSAAITAAGFGVLAGLFLMLGERSSGDLAQLLGRSEIALEDERRRSLELQKSLDDLEVELTSEYSIVRSLAFYRERLGFRINQVLVARRVMDAPLYIPNTLAFLLSETSEAGDVLFQWVKGEKWTIAFYLWNESTQRLECSCSCRPSNTDFGEGHRSWRSGEGMVGITFHRGRRLIVSDAERSELEIVMADRDEDVAAADRQRYKSVVALPIFRPTALADEGALSDENAEAAPQSRLYGVVVATSDEAMRFEADGAEVALGTLAALSQAASSILIAAELRTA